MEGQEAFTVVRYDAGGEYFPHCDTNCDGSAHTPGGRVATMIIYCEEAAIGGGTSFSSVDVFVKGKRGQALLSSYYNPATGRLDNGLSRHCGCRVTEGNKRIATLTMRKGVNATVTHESFDAAGKLIK
ncbi:hypothetical protein JKP88DRAFT_278264 [Tribonema minus]|uniref:Prolyl 4-hydroxylase alpha subunit Fe(2+) 2OG dioxygenase domain-containing protein n=1 Tax=Tribonema minus TaxID=303371 RepID=A0A835YV79_9STRA|nr:hypothetical protein JKP88DRAFT_278264 [Tribonema minus]